MCVFANWPWVFRLRTAITGIQPVIEEEDEDDIDDDDDIDLYGEEDNIRVHVMICL